jgi:Tfp pilus assembly protein PilO
MKKLRFSSFEKASFALLCTALAFSFLVVKPLQERSRLLLSRIHPAAASSSDAKVAAVYRFLKKEESPTDWLAKLYGIGRATGIELQSASYTTHEAGGRITRYEIVLPVAGSYAQLREFLKRASAEIPVLSIDQMSLKRENRNDGALQAELHLTLHMVQS